jgi:uncharacterized protein YfaP (DUF2135 family)
LTEVSGRAGDSKPPVFVTILRVIDNNDTTYSYTLADETGNQLEIIEQKTLDITLDWASANANLDLQIIEPGQITVNKNNLEGQIGSLVEDVTAGGDRGEKYQTEYGNNAVGDYDISVNYFEGQGEAEGTITFRVGNSSNQVPIKAIAPVGPAGQVVSPYQVGILRVTEVAGVLQGQFIPRIPECSSSFRVYTAWDSVADVDLHVLEPTNNNVYTQRPTGDVGYMNRSSSNQEYGPEIYQTRCGELLPGYYDIRLNLYSGD